MPSPEQSIQPEFQFPQLTHDAVAEYSRQVHLLTDASLEQEGIYPAMPCTWRPVLKTYALAKAAVEPQSCSFEQSAPGT